MNECDVKAFEAYYGEILPMLKQGEAFLLNLIGEYPIRETKDGIQPILYTKSRIKSPKSMEEKLKRKGECPDYCLLPEGKTTDEQPDTVAATGENVAVSPDIATVSRDTATKTALIKRKEKEKKENILPNPPFAKGGDEEEGSEGEKVAEGAGGGMREECDQRSATRKRNLTQEDIDRMQVPPDGCPRNFSGLLENLRLFRVPPAEQYTIVLKSNYGEIGGDIWKGFSVIRGSGGKIKLPGHYLLSVLNK